MAGYSASLGGKRRGLSKRKKKGKKLGAVVSAAKKKAARPSDKKAARPSDPTNRGLGVGKFFGKGLGSKPITPKQIIDEMKRKKSNKRGRRAPRR